VQPLVNAAPQRASQANPEIAILRMEERTESGHRPRQVSRWITYPALAVFPLASIYAGIRLGELGIGEEFMITSMESTPAENWVTSLLAVCISILVYVSWAYSNRTLRFSAMSFIFVLGYVVVLFLFGVWGLYGLVFAWALWFAYFWFVARKRLGLEQPDDQ